MQERQPLSAHTVRASIALLLFGGVGFGAVLHGIYWTGLEQGVLLFVTLPMLVGFVAALLPLPLHPIGKALLFTTICLIESFVVFSEGVICVLMAAPLFYGFAILGAVAVDLSMNRARGQRAFVWVGLPLASLLLGPPAPHPVIEVRVEQFVPGVDPTELQVRLAAPREDVGAGIPWMLKLFPQPVEMRGSGIDPGDLREIYFAGGEGKPGWLRVEVTERTADQVRFEVLEDSSHIAHWLAWQDDVIGWEAVDGGTQVTWTTRYRSELAPDWYFGPAERLAMRYALHSRLDVHTAALR